MKQTQTTKSKVTNAENFGDGLKTQMSKKTKEGDAMKKLNNIGVRDTQIESRSDFLQAYIKSAEKEKISLYERILKAKYLSYETDINLIPIVQVNFKHISLSELPWGKPYVPEDKINLNTPVVLGRDYDIIAGAHQYFNAKEKGLTKIDAVFIDSLPWKHISLSNLKKQFKDESMSISFAYNLYALLYESEYMISYDDFYNEADNLFYQDEIWFRLHQYVSSLNEGMGA